MTAVQTRYVLFTRFPGSVASVGRMLPQIEGFHPNYDGVSGQVDKGADPCQSVGFHYLQSESKRSRADDSAGSGAINLEAVSLP